MKTEYRSLDEAQNNVFIEDFGTNAGASPSLTSGEEKVLLIPLQSMLSQIAPLSSECLLDIVQIPLMWLPEERQREMYRGNNFRDGTHEMTGYRTFQYDKVKNLLEFDSQH